MWFLLRSMRTMRNLNSYERSVKQSLGLLRDCECGNPAALHPEPWLHTVHGCWPSREHLGTPWRH